MSWLDKHLVKQPKLNEESEPIEVSSWRRWVNSITSPLTEEQKSLRNKLRFHEKQIGQLSAELDAHRRRAIQLALLKELSQQLETILDAPVSAPSTVPKPKTSEKK